MKIFQNLVKYGHMKQSQLGKIFNGMSGAKKIKASLTADILLSSLTT